MPQSLIENTVDAPENRSSHKTGISPPAIQTEKAPGESRAATQGAAPNATVAPESRTSDRRADSESDESNQDRPLRGFVRRLFGLGAHGERGASLKLRQQQQRSILDFVMEDARDFQRQLSNRDRLRMDEYLTSVRDIERRLAAVETANRQTPDPDMPTPAGLGMAPRLRLVAVEWRRWREKKHLSVAGFSSNCASCSC